MSYVLWVSIVLVLFKCCNCKLCEGDTNCLTKEAKNVYPLFISGINNTVLSSDPIHSDYILVQTPELKCEFTNSNFTGLKNCNVAKLQINRADLTFFYHLECPQIVLYLNYIVNGSVVSFLVEGEGLATVILDHYVFRFNGSYEKMLDKNQKSHAQITKYVLDGEADGFVNFNFTNLYYGDQKKSDILHNFMNKNWKEMDKELRGPPINSFMGTFIKNLNKYLETVPLESIGFL